jgi:hypothetical protein
MRAEEVRGLMEAYSQVHGPNVVDIAAEIWVSACIAEGIEFSQYTLDEITEGFIADMSSEDLSESLLSEILGMPGAQNLGANLRQGFGQARRAVGGAISKAAGGVKDVAGAAAQGLAGQRTTSKNPLARGYNAVTRAASAPTRAAASFATGVLTGKPGATNPPAKPSTKPSAKPPGSGGSPIRPVPGNERAAAPTSRPSTPATASPTTKPAATTAAAKPTAPAKPAGSAMDQWAKANPKLAAAKAERDRTKGTSATTNPLMKDTKSSLPAPKSPTPSTTKTGFDLAKKGVNLAAGIDIFDIVKGHLLDEGYAETEEAAMVIMTNMSEEWRESILDENRMASRMGKMSSPPAKVGKATHSIKDLVPSKPPSEEEKEKARKALRKEGLDPVGQEDDDVDNDGKKNTKSDKYLKNRRKAVGAAIQKEELEAWVDQLIAEGYDLSEYTWEEVAEIYSEELELAEAGKNDARIRGNIKSFGSNYTPPRDWDQSANRGQGAVLNAKQKEKQRRKSLRQEELELGENRRMAADPEGRKSGYSKQPDPSKEGFTGIGNMSIKQIMAMNKKIAAKKKED